MPRQGIEPTSVSRVAPDWDLSDALPNELHRRGRNIKLRSKVLSCRSGFSNLAVPVFNLASPKLLLELLQELLQVLSFAKDTATSMNFID